MKKMVALLFILMCFVSSAYGENLSSGGAQSASVSAETAQELTVRVVVNGTVNTLTGYELGDAYYFTQADIATTLGDAALNGSKTVTQNGEAFYSLRDVAENAGFDFTHDTALGADYIWTYPDELLSGTKDEEFDRAVLLGIAQAGNMDSVITYAHFFTMLDRVVELTGSDNLSVWQSQWTNARKSSASMTRFEGMLVVLKCAIALGGDYAAFNCDWLRLNNLIGEKVWDEVGTIADPFRLIPNDEPFKGGGFENDQYIYDWDDCGVAYRYAIGRVSLVSNKTLFDYYEAENSVLPAKPLTYHDAALAALRLYESSSAASSIIPITDERAVTYDKTIITDTLLERANAHEELIGDSMPVLKGLIIGIGSEESSIPVVSEDLRNIANWGFNSARVMITFQSLFDMDVQNVEETKLKQLDKLVAAALQYNLHLNILTTTMPGRWAHFDDTTFTSVGEFDLFTNSKKQKQANAVWALLAQRYSAVPGSVLSFSPLFEVLNYNLSTGLPVKPYSPKNVAKVYGQLCGTIRQYDPDRMIIYEPTATNAAEDIIRESTVTYNALEEKYPSTIMMTNFCDNPFVYACMTAEEGEHIDNNNHSMFIPDYPVNIYAAQSHISKGKPLTLTGELVAGTKIDLYLQEVKGKGKLEIIADGEILYSENLSSKKYDVGYPLSRFYPFATSDKLISIELTSDVDNLEIGYSGTWFDWCGINVTLPETYMVERWWFPTAYDAMLQGTEDLKPYLKKTSTIMLSPNSYDQGRNIMINSDITYSSEKIWEQSTKEKIFAWAKTISEFAPGSVVRYENANFGGCTQVAAIRYYEDLHTALDKYGLGWFSNDYVEIINCGGGYVGATLVPYYGSNINIELLQQLQKWQ